MSGQEIIPAGTGANIAKYDDSQFEDLVASKGWLPRLQLMTANSNKCQEGTFPINNYALIRDQSYTDLGKEVDVGVVAWRPKALDTSGDQVVTSFDPKSELYQAIAKRADTIANSGCMHGPEFLVWVPHHGFATFYMGGKSTRREAPKIKERMNTTCTLSSKKAKTKMYQWQTPIIGDCTTPLDELPDANEAREEIEKFLNPPESDVEAVEEVSEEGRAR